jgi:ubiquinone/menaquinone biosynthesis C-methylase UbiE
MGNKVKLFFKKRIPEPKKMGINEHKEFEKLSMINYKKWMIPLVDNLLDFAKTKIDLNSKIKILDLACGPGLLTKELASRLPHALVIGVDNNKFALRLARKNCSNFKNVKFLLGNAQNLSFEDNYFDIVVCKDSLHQFKNATKALKEMFRVTKQGGLIYIQDLRKDVPYYLLKMIIPPNTLVKKLIYYSARAAYLPSEIKKILKKIGIKNYHIFIRRLTKEVKRKYKDLNLKDLKNTFRSRYILVITK